MRNLICRTIAGALLASAMVVGAPVVALAQASTVLAPTAVPPQDPPRSVLHAPRPFRVITTANLRADLTTESMVVAVLPAGTEITSDDECQCGTPIGGDNLWRHAKTADGKYGWIHDSVLQPIPID